MRDPTFRNVLVPLDGSAFASAALPTGRALAQGFAAELHTLRLLRFDKVAPIALWAEQQGDCVVCVSAHGRGRVRGAVLGSAADSLLQRLGQPIVVLGPSADRPGWSPSPGWPPPLSHRRIVACVDGTTPSEEVLPVAAAWARALDMELKILTVADDLLPSIRLDAPAGRYGVGHDAEDYVNGLVDRCRDEVPAVTGQVVTSPIGTADGVRSYLDRHPSGLVALSTHARSGAGRFLHGATAAAITRRSSVPCLLVPVAAVRPGQRERGSRSTSPSIWWSRRGSARSRSAGSHQGR